MTTLAVLSVSGLIPLLIQILIFGLIIWVIWWFLSYVGLPEPFNKVVRVIIALVVLLYLVNLLLGLSGNAFLTQ